jgi:cyclophilin family peptidyl-prolyl cis-trans isomerase
VFGKVINGMEVINLIEKAPTSQDRPREPIKVERITISD